MKRIKLTQQKFAIIDNNDFDWLNQWKWFYNNQGYAVRSKYIRSSGYGKKDGKSMTIYMHNLINKTPSNLETDHINRNKLDNRKENLRSVTRNQNQMNLGLIRSNTSGFKGVGWSKKNQNWVAYIGINYKFKFLGYYQNIQDAVRTRKEYEEKISFS